MAEQLQSGAKGATDSAKGAADKVPGSSAITDKVQSATSGVLNSIEGVGGWISSKFYGILDRFFPPEKRAALLEKIQSFMLANPKLSVSFTLSPRNTS